MDLLELGLNRTLEKDKGITDNPSDFFSSVLATEDVRKTYTQHY